MQNTRSKIMSLLLSALMALHMSGIPVDTLQRASSDPMVGQFNTWTQSEISIACLSMPPLSIRSPLGSVSHSFWSELKIAAVLLAISVTAVSGQGLSPSYTARANPSSAVAEMETSALYTAAKNEPDLTAKLTLLKELTSSNTSSVARLSALDDQWKIQLLTSNGAAFNSYLQFLRASGIPDDRMGAEHLRTVDRILLHSNTPEQAVSFYESFLKHPTLKSEIRARARISLKSAYFATGDYANFLKITGPNDRIDNYIRSLNPKTPRIQDRYEYVGSMKHLAQNPRVPVRFYLQPGISKHLKDLKQDRFGPKGRGVSDAAYIQALLEDANKLLRQFSSGAFGLSMESTQLSHSMPLFGERGNFEVFKRKTEMRAALGDRFNISLGLAEEFQGGVAYGNGLIDVSLTQKDGRQLSHELLTAVVVHEVTHELGMQHLYDHVRPHYLWMDLTSKGHIISGADPTKRDTVDGQFLMPDAKRTTIPVGISDLTKQAIGWKTTAPRTSVPADTVEPDVKLLDKIPSLDVSPIVSRLTTPRKTKQQRVLARAS